MRCRRHRPRRPPDCGRLQVAAGRARPVVSGNETASRGPVSQFSTRGRGDHEPLIFEYCRSPFRGSGNPVRLRSPVVGAGTRTAPDPRPVSPADVHVRASAGLRPTRQRHAHLLERLPGTGRRLQGGSPGPVPKAAGIRRLSHELHAGLRRQRAAVAYLLEQLHGAGRRLPYRPPGKVPLTTSPGTAPIGSTRVGLQARVTVE